MANLGELYTDFFRIDLDAPGGYARVADVVARQEDGTSVHRAFKLMRYELHGTQVGLQRFENELKMLVVITKDKYAPSAITRIFDSGFVEAELSKNLQKLRHKQEKLNPTPNLEIVSTGTDIQKFLDMKSDLMEKEPDRWLPYLVVDLAPYDDSLLRQIKAQFVGDELNLYGLPVNTIVDMALQLLDVMDYMHKKLRYAYIDWKPEHIYWNEVSRELKLIDWNVTTRLNGGPGEKQTIREDIRMFSGAALYCGLALTDPEELTKSIGPTPTVPKDMVPRIPPRYWTDNPNFYQRGEILDEKIKQLVQKALDPKQGFNSPQELKNALVQIDKQSDEQIDKKSGGDLIPKLPFDAVQHYRRARSYIAAEDYSYAVISLEVAIAAAKAAGMSYPDAEKLLISVQDILKAGEFKQKVKLALELEQWKDALNLYNKALLLDPTNITMKKELDNLRSLLNFESGLQKNGLSKIFAPTWKLQTAVDTAKGVMNPDNPMLASIQKHLHQITQIRIGGIIILLLLGFVYFSSLSGKFEFFETHVATTTLTNVPASTSTIFLTETSTQLVEPIKTSTYTNIPSITPTNTLEPTPTIFVLYYGKLESYYFKPYDEPDKNILTDVVIERNQFLIIIDKKESHGALWYKCTWEIDGIVGQGWILADRIKIVQAPTPTPTSYILDMTYGELDSTSYRPYDEPNKTLQDIVLENGQPLQILRGQEISSALWYECTWDINGIFGQGWILAEKIKIVQPPTPTVTPTATP